jgi:hypothetical protein
MVAPWILFHGAWAMQSKPTQKKESAMVRRIFFVRAFIVKRFQRLCARKKIFSRGDDSYSRNYTVAVRGAIFEE